MIGYIATTSSHSYEHLKITVGNVYTVENKSEYAYQFKVWTNFKDLSKYFDITDLNLKVYEVEIYNENSIQSYNGAYILIDKMKIIREVPLSEHKLISYFHNNKNQLIYRKNNITDEEEWFDYEEDGDTLITKYKTSKGIIRIKHTVNDKTTYTKYVDKNYSVETFYNDHNKPIKYVYGDGSSFMCDYEYDDNDNMIHYKDNDGVEKWLKYDDKNRLIEQMSSTHIYITYQYNDDENTETYTFKDNTLDMTYSEIITYNDKHQIIKKENSDHCVEEWEYDKNGNIIKYTSTENPDYNFYQKFDEDNNLIWCKNDDYDYYVHIESSTIIGYKATINFKCNDLTYEVGKTYTISDMRMCKYGFHFCRKKEDVLKYYSPCLEFKLLELEILGDIIDDSDGTKSVTNKLKVIREIPLEEHQLYTVNDDNTITYSEEYCNCQKPYKLTKTINDKNNVLIDVFECLNDSYIEYSTQIEKDNIKYDVRRTYENNKLTFEEVLRTEETINTENGKIVKIKDDYKEIIMEYDLNNNLLKKTTNYLTFNDRPSTYETFEYDANNNLIHSLNSMNNYEVWNTYDKHNNLIHCKNSNGYEYKQTFNKSNQLLKYKDNKGIKREYEYDDEGKCCYKKIIEKRKCVQEEKFDEYGNPVYTRVDNVEKFSTFTSDGKLLCELIFIKNILTSEIRIVYDTNSNLIYKKYHKLNDDYEYNIQIL